VTIVDPPEGSAFRSRGLLRKALAGVLLGLLVGMSLAAGAEYTSRRRRDSPEEYEALRHAGRQVVRELGLHRALSRGDS
jgi:hypothetical protein